MNNIIDYFEYGTWEIFKNEKRQPMKRLGYRYGHLALLRTDFHCDYCDGLHESWSVANLVSGTYPFPNAVFRNIDEGCAYIYEITPLAKWDTVNVKETAKLAGSLVSICLKHSGIPMKLLALIDGLDLGKGQTPGVVAGLNGYTKQ